MNLKNSILVCLALHFFSFSGLQAQNTDLELLRISNELIKANNIQDSLYVVFENLKLAQIQNQIKTFIIPELKENEIIINHKAFSLVYDEKHEQAKWVAHVISKEIISGNQTRTNQFRIDSMIETGSACEKDFFTTQLQEDSTFKYNGFGYDRGHLAPSADFKWSAVALAESFFYSNMSPQKPEFNRVGWSMLEDLLRTYVIEKKVDLYIVTGPVLNDSLPVIEQSLNKVSIPKFFYKVAYDAVNNKGIGFYFPNEEISYPCEYYAYSIDSIEKFSGINFFHALDDKLENHVEQQYIIADWLSEKEKNDAIPMRNNELPKGAYNTIQASSFTDLNQKIMVCGKVVGAYTPKNGHTFLSIDKAFPKQIFTVTIFKPNRINFSYDPAKFLLGKRICINGTIGAYKGKPSMVISNEKSIEILQSPEVKTE